MFQVVPLLFAAFQGIIYYSSGNGGSSDVNDCTVLINPCLTVQAACESSVARKETAALIHVIDSDSTSCNFNSGCFDITTDTTITGLETNSVKICHPDSREQDYIIGINASVLMEKLSITDATSVSLWSNAPAISVFSSGSLTLSTVTLTPPSSGSSYVDRKSPLIDSTSGALKLIGTTMEDFTLANASLLAVSVEEGKFSMECSEVPDEDDAEKLVTEPCSFRYIRRTYGNGSVFDIDLPHSSSVFQLHNAVFSNCRSDNGGPVYIDVWDASAHYSFDNIWFTSSGSSSQYLYMVFPAKPTSSPFQWFFTSLFDIVRIYNSVLLEFPEEGNISRYSLARLVDSLFVSSDGSSSDSCGSYSTTCSSLTKSTTKQYTFISSNSDPVTSALTYTKAGVVLASYDTTYTVTITLKPAVTTSLFTVNSGSDVTLLELALQLDTYTNSDNEDIATFTAPVFTVAGELTLNEIVVDGSSVTLSSHLIDASTGKLNLTRVGFSSFELQSKTLLNINAAPGKFVSESASFSDIERATGNGAVLEASVSTGTFHLTDSSFTDCSTSAGSGGALSLTVTGGDVLFTASGSFESCSATQTATEGTGNGGAMCISISAGSLTLGSDEEDDSTDPPSHPTVEFTSCSARIGNSVFIKASGSATLLLTYLSFKDSSSSCTAGGGIYVDTSIGASGSITFSSLSFSNIASVEDGAGIYLACSGPSPIAFDSLSFSDCSASNGNAIYLDLKSTPTLIFTALTYSPTSDADVCIQTYTDTSPNYITPSQSLWDSAWAGLIADSTLDTSCTPFLIRKDSGSAKSIFELEPDVVFYANSSTDAECDSTTASSSSCTIARILETSAYKSANRVRIYLDTYTESSALDFTKTLVNISSYAGSPTLTFDKLCTTDASSALVWKDALVKVSGTLAINSISVDFTCPEYTIKTSIFTLSSGASLTLNEVEISDTKTWETTPVKASSGTLTLTGGTQFSGFQLSDCTLLAINTATGGFVTDGCVFSGISASYTGATGSVISATVSTGQTLAITNAGFDLCTSSQGGAIHVVVDGGSFILGSAEETQQVTFARCSATRGGAVYVDVKSGSFQFGSLPVTSEDGTTSLPLPVSFSAFLDTAGVGAAAYISLASWSSLTLGHVYIPVYSDNSSLYIVSDEDVNKANWDQFHLYTDYSSSSDSYSFSQTDWIKSGKYVIYESETHTLYDIFSLGYNKLTVDSSSPSTDLYCGTPSIASMDPCSTLEIALKTINALRTKPEMIEILTSKDSTSLSPSSSLTFHYPLTVYSRYVKDEDEEDVTEEVINRNLTVINVDNDAPILIASTVTFRDLSFKLSYSSSSHSNGGSSDETLFSTSADGVLNLVNVLVVQDADHSHSRIGCPVFNTSLGKVSLSQCEFVQMQLQYPLFVISSTDGISFSDTNNFTNLHGKDSAAFAVTLNTSSHSFHLSSSVFTNCTTEGNGGAVSVAMTRGSLSIKDCTFTQCSAVAEEEDNPNWYLWPERFLVMAGGYGGAVYLDIQQEDRDKLDLSFSSVSFSANTADSSGDSLYMTVRDEDVLKHKAFKDLVPDTETEGLFTYAVVDTSTAPPKLASKELPGVVHAGLSTGTIVAIILASVAFVAIVVVAVLLCLFVSACPLYKCLHKDGSGKVAAEEMDDVQSIKPSDGSSSSSSSSSDVSSSYPSSSSVSATEEPESS